MSGRKPTNKITNFIWDYYLTNREITRQNDEYRRGHPDEGWNTGAKVLLGLIVIGLIGIAVKYLVF